MAVRMNYFRSKNIHLFWGILLGLTAFLATIGAASVSAQETLRIATQNLDAGNSDPSIALSRNSIKLLMLVHDTVIGLDSEGNLDPNVGLAYKWEMGPDSKTFTVWIRDGVKFHNGYDVTAHDVKFSLDRYVFDENSKGADKKEIAQYLDRIEVVEPNKVVYHLKEPNVTFWVYLTAHRTAGWVVSKKYTEEVGDEGAIQNPVGSGPYRFSKLVPNSYFEYEAVENHWRTGTPKFKKIRYTKVAEEGTRVALLQSGEVDAINISAGRVDEAKQAGFSIVGKEEALGIGVHFLRQWYEGSPVGDPRVREAMTLAVNGNEILEFMFKGQGKVTGNYPMGPMSAGYKEVPPVPYDPERAKQILQEVKADFPEWAADGYPIHVHAPAVFPESADVAQALGAYWTAVGLKPTLHPIEPSLYWPIWGGKEEPFGLPGVALYGYGQRWSMVIGANQNWTTYGQWRHGGDANLDAIVERWRAAESLDAWYAEVGNIQQYVSDNFITLPIVNVNEIWAVNPSVIQEWNLGMVNYDVNAEFLFSTK